MGDGDCERVEELGEMDEEDARSTAGNLVRSGAAQLEALRL